MNLESGSQVYKIKPSKKFQSSFKTLKKRHYKGKKSQETFTQAVRQINRDLSNNPFLPNSKPEPLPKKIQLEENLGFRKYSFRMPNLQGASEEGRLIYLVDREKYEIELVWIYTHEEFPKRPSDRNLKQILEEIQQTREESDLIEPEDNDTERE